MLLWLNIIARTGSCVRQLVTGLWRRWGRIYYERRDYEEADADACERIMTGLRGKLARLAGRPSAIGTVACADEFDYHDPVDGSVSERQGIRLKFEGGARIVMRLSGTGTEGATLRLYAERHDSRLDRDPHEYLEPVFDTMDQIAGVSALTRMNAPTLVT